ncbi:MULTISPECIES: immunity 53 family protein [Sphingobacterium]|uniref:immunity 53 family protein n=1 Tax=Sphingobacterium TaxID=28453 RepID=UPI00257D5FDD|nr:MULTISPECIES: immunity 53 family protein [Sphingobacterium]
MNDLKGLMDWYQSNCDGDWEHIYGIKITTLDNPGWSFCANILETKLEGRSFFEESIENDDDWYSLNCDGEIFKGYCSPNKLDFVIDKFVKFAQSKIT